MLSPMRAFLAALLILGPAAAAAAGTIYKWVDEKGVTHYSDQPHPGAEKVQVESPQTYSAPPVPQGSKPQAPADPNAAPFEYTRIEIWKPQNDESFVNTGNTVTVRLRLEPELQNGHSIWIYLDGKRVDGMPSTGNTFQLNEVYRGTHTVTALVTDANGKQLISSTPVIFHMHQTSILSPARR